jgi:1,4-dihydroxy-2-naphthoyl-CoA hydrolase
MLGLKGRKIEGEVLAHVADMVDDDVALREAPLAVDAVEPVAIPAGDNRLQRQLGCLLKYDERRAHDRGIRLLVDVDGDVGREVACPQRAVVVHAIRAPVESGDRVAARDCAVDALVRELRVGEEFGECVEIGRVHEFGVAIHQRSDRVVALPRAGSHEADISRAVASAIVTNVPSDAPYQLRIAPEDAFDATIGFVIDESDEIGRCAGHLAVTPRVCQPMGIVHGGVYAAIAETLASHGTARGVLANGKVPLGMSNNTSFLRPVSEGSVRGVGTAVHRGGTTWVWDVEMRDDLDRLCAVSRVTIAVRDHGPK